MQLKKCNWFLIQQKVENDIAYQNCITIETHQIIKKAIKNHDKVIENNKVIEMSLLPFSAISCYSYAQYN